MINKYTKLIIANWKMHPDTLHDAKKIFSDLKRKNIKTDNTIVICPPFVYLSELSTNYRGRNFEFGVQDVSRNSTGEHTGEISIEMLKDLKAKWVIIGHAEQRERGDNDQIVAAKLKNTIDNKMNALLCIGEPHRDDHGNFLRFIENQLRESLSLVSKNKVSNLVIVYEPVWSIGKGKKPPTGHELHQVTLFIRKILSSIYDRKIGMTIPILYGGSVDSSNCNELIEVGNVDGLLVGRSSLNPHVFADIVKAIK